MTGSQEVDSSILFSSTKQFKGLAETLIPFFVFKIDGVLSICLLTDCRAWHTGEYISIYEAGQLMSTALLLIDIQKDYFPGGRMELVGSIEAAGAAERLLAAFRRAAWPVYHIRHISSRPTASFFLPDTSGIEIYPGVAPLPDEPVITKHFPNSFRDTDLLERLKAAGISRLLVCGMMTSMCVDATVRAAFDFGFGCTVAEDACATRNLTFGGEEIPASHVHGSFLAALGAVYANIRTTDAILEGITAADR